MAHHREQGFMLIALVIAMLVIALLVGALVSINVTKDLSGPLYVNSTQAFYLAQAGAEYGLRYATDNNSSFCADPVALFSALGSISSGNGTFTLSYDGGLKQLTSIGEVGTIGDAGYAKRSVTIDSFDSFQPGCACLDIDASYTPYRSGRVAYYRMLNNCGCSVRILYVYIAKTGGTNQARLDRIRFNGSSRWTGSTLVSTDPASPTYFNTSDYNLPTGARNCDLRCRNANQVAGTWYVTFYYNDCSATLTSTTVSFTIP